MNRILLSLLLLLSFASMQGTDTFEVIKGDASVLKDGGDVTLTVNFEDATYDYEEPLIEHYKNLKYLESRTPEFIAEGFADKTKKSHIVEDPAAANFAITVNVENMDAYFKAFPLPGHVTKVWGTIEFKEIATGNTVCVVRITESEGDRDLSVDDSFKECFYTVGQAIGRAMRRGKF